MKYAIGVDLGGTKIEALLLDPEGAELARIRKPTPRPHEYGAILNVIQMLVEEVSQRMPENNSSTLGIGIPGSIDRRTGLVRNANTTVLIGKPLQSDLEHKLGRPLAVENDANCFTLAESRAGAARGSDLVFGVILGTGCGGGIVWRGELHTGAHHLAGEWGHVVMDPLGPPCYCGKCGCVETLVSGGGVESAYLRRFGMKIRMEEIVTAARQRDPHALSVLNQFLDDFGRCLSAVVNILDPSCIVLGGGLSNIDELYSQGAERLTHYAFHDALRTPLLRNAMGDSSGVYGAAWIGV